MSATTGERAQAAQPGEKEITLFRLYIADETANSIRAIVNLRSICQEHLQGCHNVQVVDILEEPLRALSEGVFVTPTLVRLLPLPVLKLVGDLSETETVLRALGLGGSRK